jgi:hypothetical protein
VELMKKYGNSEPSTPGGCKGIDGCKEYCLKNMDECKKWCQDNPDFCGTELGGNIPSSSGGNGNTVVVQNGNTTERPDGQPMQQQNVVQRQPTQPQMVDGPSGSSGGAGQACSGCFNNGVCDPGECASCTDCMGGVT